MDFILKVVHAPNFLTRENKLSRAGAFLFAFSVLHALPNAVLLFPGNGLQLYEDYAKQARGMWILPLFELYLLLSFIVHVLLAVRAVLNRRSLGWLSLSGMIMIIFLTKHLIDFRFADLHANPQSTYLPQQLKPQKLFYVMGITATTVHVFGAIRPSWLFALDFRGDEISQLIGIGRFLLLVSSVLYLVPVLVI